MLGAWRHVRHMSTPNNALSRGPGVRSFASRSRPRKERTRQPDLPELANENGPPKRAAEERKRGRRYARNLSTMAAPIPATIISVSMADMTPTLKSTRSAPLISAPVVGDPPRDSRRLPPYAGSGQPFSAELIGHCRAETQSRRAFGADQPRPLDDPGVAKLRRIEGR
jgi:hypothetical protein